MHGFKVLIGVVAFAASLAGFAQTSFAFRLHMPHFHAPTPHYGGPFANAMGGPLHPYPPGYVPR